MMVLALLSDTSNPEVNHSIFNDLISFGIKLLNGGNYEV